MDAYVGLLGCGTVGSGVIELIERRAAKISDLTGLRPVIRKVLVRNPDKPRSVAIAPGWLTTNPQDILDDDEISVVIETIGGIEPARSLLLAAIGAGKHVITANKDLMAVHGAEIHDAALRSGVTVMFEAAVGGAIPVIRPLRECLTANEITNLKGIINGTCNYILSKMTETGADFDDVLREAQQLGYAESNPSSDIDGLDAARKLVILASLAFHSEVRLDQVEVVGIRDVTAADVAYASELGCVVKLIAEGADAADALVLRVRPTLVPKHHPLAHVSDANNALYVYGDAAGELMFYGRGAGSLPTASAIVGDLIDVLRNLAIGTADSMPIYCLNSKPVDAQAGPPEPYYLRLVAADQPGVFARIAGIFGDAQVSMETVLQKRVRGSQAEIVIVTHETSASQINQVADRLAAAANVCQVCCVLPVLS